MYKLFSVAVAFGAALTLAGPAVAATKPSVAALQVALRAHGHYPAAVDGVDGPLTRAGLVSFQQRTGLAPNGRLGQATRAALGPLGRPLLGQRELGIGAVGWDVSALEFGLVPFGLSPKSVDGRFTAATAQALARFQAKRGLPADGIAGKQTYRTLGKNGGWTFTPSVRLTHVVQVGDSFFSIAEHYGVSPLLLAKESGLELSAVIVPGQRLTLPKGTREIGSGRASVSLPVAASQDEVRASIDRWSATYGVDPRLARATAWMESGFQQSVVSNVGAIGVMQLLPGTWAWVDQILLGTTTPRTYDGNIRAGVRYLRWLLDQFNGDRRLALAGYYQGAQAVRDRGLFDDTKRYVSIIFKLYGSV
jgi:peptidoglycan hydrolase-like protein with peptidoglycan-binding domain/LysM repeat protein